MKKAKTLLNGWHREKIKYFIYGAGLPVIANAVGGLIKIIQHKKTGLLISPVDPDKFYDSVKQLVKDKGLRKEMGEKGKLRAAGFSWDKVMDKYKTVFNNQ
ncbi:MAG: glycosyltransferase [Nitrospinota bacterium]